MVYRGRVQDGVVIFDSDVKPEEGLPVSVRALRRRPSRPSGKKGRSTTFYERYKDLIGAAKGLPADFSTQLDHYLYGTPKRK